MIFVFPLATISCSMRMGMQWWLILEVGYILQCFMSTQKTLYLFFSQMQYYSPETCEHTLIYLSWWSDSLTTSWCTLSDCGISFASSTESRFLQSVEEDNMTKQPGVSAVSSFWFSRWRTQNPLEWVFAFFGQILSNQRIRHFVLKCMLLFCGSTSQSFCWLLPSITH